MNVRTKKYIFLGLHLLFLVTPILLLSPELALAQSSGALPVAEDPNKTVEPTTFEGMMATIMNFFMSAAALLTWLGGITLNAGIYYGVVTMASFVNDLGAITLAWGLLRDIGNIVLIFALLAVGISTIVGVQNYGYKTLLPKVIIVAIALNFSLFVTKVVIDAGNILATQFYKEIVGGTIQPPFGGGESDGGLSGRLMNDLNLTTLYDTSRNAATNGGSNTSITAGSIILIGIIGTIFFLITAFIFFALGIMLISRFVILVFLMIISPLAFVAQAIPYLQGQWKKWLDTLISQTFFAPAVMLLLLISFNITRDIKNVLNTPAVAEMATGAPVAAQISLAFIIAIGFMMASMLVAKQLSAFGGSFAQEMAGKAVFGTLGFAGRNTAGRASARIGDSVRKSALGRTEVGRQIAQFADKGAKASFDARSSSRVKNLEKVGISMGKGSGKGGFAAAETAAIKARTSYAESLKQSDKEKNQEEELKTRIEKEKVSLNTQEKAESDKISEREKQLTREYTLKKEALEQDRLVAKTKGDNVGDARKTREIADLRQKYDTEIDLISKEKNLIKERREAEEKQKIEPLKKELESVDEKSPQRKYADNLAEAKLAGTKAGAVAGAAAGIAAGAVLGGIGAIPGGILGGALGGTWGGNIKEFNNQAVAKIRKELKKTDKDKERDALIKAAKEGAKEGSKKEDE